MLLWSQVQVPTSSSNRITWISLNHSTLTILPRHSQYNQWLYSNNCPSHIRLASLRMPTISPQVQSATPSWQAQSTQWALILWWTIRYLATTTTMDLTLISSGRTLPDSTTPWWETMAAWWAVIWWHNSSNSNSNSWWCSRCSSNCCNNSKWWISSNRCLSTSILILWINSNNNSRDHKALQLITLIQEEPTPMESSSFGETS